MRCQPNVVGRWALSCQKWPGSDSGRVATSHTAVSAPSEVSRSSGRVTTRNTGNAPATPGVSTQPRVHALDPNVRTREPVRPRLGERHLHPLGSRVHPNTVVITGFRFHVVDRKRRGVHTSRGHENDRRAMGIPQQRQQLLGHEVRPQDVASQLGFVTLGRLDALLRHRTGVVNQPMEFFDATGKVFAPCPNGVQIGYIADFFDHHRTGHRAPDRTRRMPDLVGVSAKQMDGRVEFGERAGDGLAYPCRRTGDDNALSGHRLWPRVSRPPCPPQT